MSNVQRHTLVTREVEYSMPVPAYWDDLESMLSWIRRDLGDKAKYGDAVRVRVTDDRLILSTTVSVTHE